MKSFRTAAVVALGLTPVTGIIVAAEAPSVAEVVVVGERDALAERQEAPTAKIIVDRETIEKHADQTVGAVLRRLPGVFFAGPPDEDKDVRLRGLDKEYTQVLIDGERMPGGGEKRELQVDRIPASMVERIEIIRNGSAEFDAQGIAGTINIVLKKAPRERLAQFNLSGGYVEGERGTGSLGFGYGDSDGAFGYLLNGNLQTRTTVKDKTKQSFKGDGTPDKSEREEERKDFREFNFAPRLSWSLAGGDSLELNPLLLRSTEDKDKTKDKFKANGTSDGAETEAEEKRRTGLGLTGKWRHRLAGGGRLETTLSARRSDEDKEKTKLTFKADGSLDKTTLEDEDKSDRELLARLVAELPLGERHLFKSGVEWLDKDRNKDKTTIENGTPKSGPKDEYALAERRLSGFVQDEYQLGDNGVLTPGLRLEHSKSDLTTNAGGTRSDSYLDLLPSAHYLHRLTPADNLRASVARTLRRPKFDDLVPFIDAKDGTLNKPDKVGNPELQAESAIGYELGWEHFFSRRAGVVGVNGFYRDVSDLIENRVDLNTGSGRYEEKPVNVGDGKVWGVELDGKRRLDVVGLPGVTLHGNIAWLDSEVTDAATGQKRRFKEQPDYTANLGFDYAPGGSAWEFGANYNRIAAIDSDEIKEDGKRNLSHEAAKAFLDVYAVRRLNKTFTLRFSASNLLEAEKDKRTTVFKADGSIEKIDQDIEGSSRRFLVSLEGRF